MLARMPGVLSTVTVVVLKSVQPLTTGFAFDSTSSVRVLTDDAPEKATGAGVPAPAEVICALRQDWSDLVQVWSRDTKIEVVTNDEYCLAECARLRTELRLDQRQPTHLERYLDKVLMKQALRQAEVAVPAWVPLDRIPTPEAMTEPPAPLSLPIVAKPRQEANSRGVQVISTRPEWAAWLTQHAGQQGWEVEQHIPAPMYFVDGLVVDGQYTPVIVGAYLGPLLPQPGVNIHGAVSIPVSDPRWARAAALGRRVAQALGVEGRFASHLEFFATDDRDVVMEVCARAPGALVSEMARATAGINLEQAHLRLGAGQSAPRVVQTGLQAAWISVLSRPADQYLRPPECASQLDVVRLPLPDRATGRYVALMALLTHPDIATLHHDITVCTAHAWFLETVVD